VHFTVRCCTAVTSIVNGVASCDSC
jgi:hypothetical protein